MPQVLLPRLLILLTAGGGATAATYSALVDSVRERALRLFHVTLTHCYLAALGLEEGGCSECWSGFKKF